MCIRDRQYLQQVVTGTSKLRDDLREKLQQAGMSLPESHTNFLLLPTADDSAVSTLDNKLKNGGFIARAMSGYGLGNCLRLTIGTNENMQQVSRVLLASDD